MRYAAASVRCYSMCRREKIESSRTWPWLRGPSRSDDGVLGLGLEKNPVFDFGLESKPVFYENEDRI